jgi:class 3 adenylate cyclase
LAEKTPTVPASPNKKKALKRHLFSLRVKFILVLTFLICVLMGVVTWLVLDQTRQTLIQQVIDRGESQVRSLALNSEDPLLAQLSKSVSQQGGAMGEDVDLGLMQLVRDTMKLESSAAVRNIPSGLAPWQEKLLESSNVLNVMAQKYFWPDDAGLQQGDMEYAFILDNTNKFVAYMDKDAGTHPEQSMRKVMEHETYTAPSGLKPIGDESTLTQTYFADHDRTLYDISATVRDRVLGHKIGEVHIGMNQNTITRVVRYVGVAIILTTVAILLAGIIFMTIFVTILIKPIGLLVNGVSAIAAGNFDQKINIKRSDELGDLTDAFNDMAKSLREKEVIKGAFSKYVTKSVVDRILEHQDGLKLGGEKKTITIFFSDIRGFTPMSEVLSAEEVVHILNEYFTAMTAIIFKYEGTLDKFMGDAIMAVFGAPIEMADHAERAVLAAIEMSEKMKQLQAKWKTEGKKEVNIGIGINTAIGDNVNLTQRLESVAEKGQILISSATYEKVKHKVIANMLDPIKVKGKTEKVIAYSVQGLRT